VTPEACPHEQDVVRAVVLGSWPRGGDEELRTHVEACESCAEAVTIAMLFGEQRDRVLHDIRVPAAGQVWWRAALRAHAEAAQAARRPMVWLHGIAGACAAGFGAALIALAWPWIREAIAWIAAREFDLPDVQPLMAVLRPGMPLALAVVACLVLTPIVVYFALSDD
jgi:hypothetical protein